MPALASSASKSQRGSFEQSVRLNQLIQLPPSGQLLSAALSCLSLALPCRGTRQTCFSAWESLLGWLLPSSTVSWAESFGANCFLPLALRPRPSGQIRKVHLTEEALQRILGLPGVLLFCFPYPSQPLPALALELPVGAH